MSLTALAEVENQVQKFWAPRYMQEFREKLLLAALINKEYEGEIRREGDTVRVSQVNAPEGQNLTVGVDADTFAAQKVSTSFVDIKADKRAVAAYKFADLVELQSQIDNNKPEVRQSLMFAMMQQINDYLYSLVAPSASDPAHVVTGTSALDKAALLSIRNKAAAAKWTKEKGWYLLAGTEYYGDIIGDEKLSNRDFGGDDVPMIGGQTSLRRFGFNVLEDDSRDSKYALAFHPDFLHMVTQQQVRVKLSDLHSNQQFGILLSVDIVYGAKVGIDGDKKHITVED